MPRCKNVKEVLDDMKNEYQTRIQRELESIHASIKMGHIDRAKESADLIDKHKEKISLLDQVAYRLEQEANIE